MQPTVSLAKDADQYRYSTVEFEAVIWKDRSDWGDMQWCCDIRYRYPGKSDRHLQCDTLRAIKSALYWIERGE
jgi:hypothetical protein